ncbi:MAG: hypothetical protein ACOY3K_01270 [Candidatus Omnitrophota bacterium]
MGIRTRRALAVLTSAIFVASDAAFSLPQPGIDVRKVVETPQIFQIQIPQDLATVEDIYEAPPKLEPRLVLHIQDAHGNYDAQVRIKEILKFLRKEYGFDLLFVEGGVGEQKAEDLKFFPDPEINSRIADELTKKGIMSGPELYLLDEPEGMKTIGIEEADLYRGNYAAFLQVYRQENLTNLFAEVFDARVDLLSSRMFRPATRKLIREWKSFSDGRREFLPYLQELAKGAKEYIGLDLESLFAQVEWPQITRLLVIQKMQTEIVPEKVTAEKEALLQFLQAQGIAGEILEGLREIDDQAVQRIHMKAKRDRGEAPRHLLEKLQDAAGPKGFKFQDYPNFSLMAGSYILRSELESGALFEEIDRLFSKILVELTKTEEEKNLLDLFRDIELVKKLLRLELSRKEWERALYRYDWIQPDAVYHRLVKLQEKAGALTEHRFAKSLDDFEASKAKINSVFNAAFQFYEYANRRETTFYERMKKEMDTRNARKAIVVTGGFHTEGLMELFKADEVSYGVLTPRMAQAGDRSAYLATMLGTHKTMFDVANLAGAKIANAVSLGQEASLQPLSDVIAGELMKMGAVSDQVFDQLNELTASQNLGLRYELDRAKKILTLRAGNVSWQFSVQILDAASVKIVVVLRSEGRFGATPVTEQVVFAPGPRRAELRINSFIAETPVSSEVASWGRAFGNRFGPTHGIFPLGTGAETIMEQLGLRNTGAAGLPAWVTSAPANLIAIRDGMPTRAEVRDMVAWMQATRDDRLLVVALTDDRPAVNVLMQEIPPALRNRLAIQAILPTQKTFVLAAVNQWTRPLNQRTSGLQPFILLQGPIASQQFADIADAIAEPGAIVSDRDSLEGFSHVAGETWISMALAKLGEAIQTQFPGVLLREDWAGYVMIPRFKFNREKLGDVYERLDQLLVTIRQMASAA